MTLALIGLVDRELTKQCCRQWVGFIAPIRLGKKLAFDLRGRFEIRFQACNSSSSAFASFRSSVSKPSVNQL